MIEVRKLRWTTKQLLAMFLKAERVKQESTCLLEDTILKLKDRNEHQRLIFEEICFKEDVKRDEARRIV